MKDIAGKEINIGDTVAFALHNKLVLGDIVTTCCESLVINVHKTEYIRDAKQVVKVFDKKFNDVLDYLDKIIKG